MANFTKQAIKASFLKLLNERPLTKISVRDIVEDCGINRNSFYYHFQDIPALVTEIITDQTDLLIHKYPTIDSLDGCVRAAFHFAENNQRAVMHIYNSVNRDAFERSTMEICEYVVNTYLKTAFPDRPVNETDHRVIANYIKCTLFGMCIDWIRGGMTESAYNDLTRLIELSRDLPELLIQRSHETS